MIRNRPVIVSFILFVSLFSVLLFLLFFIFFFLFCFVPHFFPCTLSCLTIFLLGLKSIGWPGKYGTRHRTQCRGAIKIHEAWKTMLAPDFAFVPADRNCVISHFTRFMRRVEYQNNWIPREFVIYKQPLNASESHQLPPPPHPHLIGASFFRREIYFYDESNWFSDSRIFSLEIDKKRNEFVRIYTVLWLEDLFGIWLNIIRSINE